MDTNRTFGVWLKNQRKALGLTQKELAHIIGYAVSTIQQFETGRARPSSIAAYQLAQLFSIPLEQVEIFVRWARKLPLSKDAEPAPPEEIAPWLTLTKRPLLRVFLCHASEDKPDVRKLYNRLRDDNIAAWLDEEDLLPGQDWQEEIPRAVRMSDIVLVCLSPRATTKSGYVQKEIKLALDVADEQPPGTIFLIPVRLEACRTPDRLRRWQWVNLFEEGGYERLLKSLRERAGRITEKP